MNTSAFEAMDYATELDAIRAAKYGEGEERVNALATLWDAYQPAARAAVAMFRGQIDEEDAMQAAYVAFLEAIEASEGDKRLAFTIQQYLRGGLSEAVTQEWDWAIPSRTLKRFFSILRRADGDVAEGARIAPTYAMTSETFTHIATLWLSTDSLRGSEREDTSEPNYSGVLVGAESRDEFALADDVMLARFARDSLADPLERQIVDLTYGFVPVEYEGALIPAPVRDDVIGALIGKSGRTVRRRRTDALRTMRAAIGLDNYEEQN